MIAVISDIHGNLPALESVMDDIDNYGVSHIYSLGDVSGYYPFINETIAILRERNIVNLIGNHDRYIINDIECSRSYSANECLKYQKSVITEENKQWLIRSIVKYETNILSMVHGGWRNNEDEYLYNINDNYFEQLPQKYFFCGHTHVQKHIFLKHNKQFINPGSVGQPRDGNNRAAYCLFNINTGSIKLRRVKYDIDRVVFKMKQLGFDSRNYINLYKGTRIGGNIDSIIYQKNNI